MDSRKAHYKKTLAGLLVLTFLIPLGVGLPIPDHSRANAQLPVTDVLGNIQATISAGEAVVISTFEGISSYSLAYISFKESILDSLAWFAAKALIKHMTRSIVNWINSGFEGNPSFVTDIGGFLTDVVDAEIGKFIEGSELGFLCDPFQLQIRLSLALKYGQLEDQISCRLSEVVDNVDDFISGTAGSFQKGGWRGWFQLTVQDNPYNRYLEAETALQIRIAGATFESTKELDFGKGFFSWKECTPRGTVGDVDCEIVTPGSFIESQLELVAGSGIRQLELADEINEIVGALAVQLIGQVFSSAGGGVSGLSRRSNAGGNTYLDNLASSNDIPDGLSGGAGEILSIDGTLAVENKHRENVSSTLNAIRRTEGLLLQLASCNPVQANATINNQIDPVRGPLEEDLSNTDRNIILLRGFQARLSTTTKTEEAQKIIDEYTSLAQNGIFHSVSEVAKADVANQEARQRLQTLDTQIQQQITLCASFRISGVGEGI